MLRVSDSSIMNTAKLSVHDTTFLIPEKNVQNIFNPREKKFFTALNLN